MRPVVVVWCLITRLPKPLLLATLFGWMVMTGKEVLPAMPDLCFSSSSVAGRLTTQVDVALADKGLFLTALAWVAMILAMMPPLLAGPLLHVWRRSFSRRRPRAVGAFVLAYLLVWIAAGTILVPAAIVLNAWSQTVALAPILPALLIAFVWQVTPSKQWFLNACHGRPPLAAYGNRADLDVFRFGVARGLSCAATCWAFMLVVLVSSGIVHWAVMAATMILALLERKRGPQPATWFNGVRLSV
ncbi:DUF2182 domain-containing protein [Rhizobium sp. YAF28]|uniref:copper chaperone n=1 Tax=Rhizobium sp. YAF28 TaxID=3233081 RepID=UPI003F9A3311